MGYPAVTSAVSGPDRPAYPLHSVDHALRLLLFPPLTTGEKAALFQTNAERVRGAGVS
jgi:hypothetical protein